MFQKKILLACYGGGHAAMLLPVFRELQKNTALDVSVMAFTGARFNFDSAQIPYFSFKDTFEFKNSVQAAKLGERFADTTSSLIPREETIAYMGLSIEDLIERHGESAAMDLFRQQGRAAFLPIQFFKSLLRREKYDLVVTTNSPRAEKALVFAARELGIPSVVVVDLFDHREFIDRTALPGYGDKICVLNEYVRDEMIKLGRPSDEIVVTGNPAFDRLADARLKTEAKSLRAERNWVGKKIILWARCNDPDSLELNPSVEKRLSEYAIKNPNTVLVIRPHPNENLESLEFEPNAFISTRKDPLPPLLESSDIVITTLSTVGLEGVLLGKPMIQLRMTDFAAASPYVELGLATGAKNLDEMEDALRKLLTSHSPTTHKANSAPLGTAAASVASVIERLLLTIKRT